MLSPSPAPRLVSRDTELTTLFRRSRIFSGLSDEQLQELSRHASWGSVREKSPLGLPNLGASVVYFLISGRAKVCHAMDGTKQPILYFVNQGELIGEQAILFGDLDQDDSVESVEPCQVASLPTKLLRRYVLQEPAFCMDLAELIGRRRLLVEQRIRHTMFLSNRIRVAHLLLDLAEHAGNTGQSAELGMKLSHQDLANLVGSTRETVTVVLGQMQSEGLLTIHRRRITLRDTARLAEEVGRSFGDAIRLDQRAHRQYSGSKSTQRVLSGQTSSPEESRTQ